MRTYTTISIYLDFLIFWISFFSLEEEDQLREKRSCNKTIYELHLIDDPNSTTTQKFMCPHEKFLSKSYSQKHNFFLFGGKRETKQSKAERSSEGREWENR